MRSNSLSGFNLVGVGNLSKEWEDLGISMPVGDDGDVCGPPKSLAEPVIKALPDCKGDAKTGDDPLPTPVGELGGTAAVAPIKVGEFVCGEKFDCCCLEPSLVTVKVGVLELLSDFEATPGPTLGDPLPLAFELLEIGVAFLPVFEPFEETPLLLLGLDFCLLELLDEDCCLEDELEVPWEFLDFSSEDLLLELPPIPVFWTELELEFTDPLLLTPPVVEESFSLSFFLLFVLEEPPVAFLISFCLNPRIILQKKKKRETNNTKVLKGILYSIIPSESYCTILTITIVTVISNLGHYQLKTAPLFLSKRTKSPAATAAELLKIKRIL